MSATATAHDSHLFVDDVVTALTGTVDGGANAASALKQQMQRAAQEFDQRTAEAFARALLDSLCQDPSDLRRLEALLILGLAHPAVLEKHRISLATEGRRLAHLLERAGETERAKCMLEMLCTQMPKERTIDRELTGMIRRSGNTIELVERYLRRADEAVARSKPLEAIALLQEVVLLDRTRRDVARMIRDLRWQVKERKTRLRRRLRSTALFLVFSALIAGTVLRERKIDAAYAALPVAQDGDATALHARLDELEALIASERVWTGVFQAITERNRLQGALDRLEVQSTPTTHAVAFEESSQEESAEDARVRGNLLAQQGKFDEALVDLRRALELGPQSWEHRARVQADVAAIEDFRTKKHR